MEIKSAQDLREQCFYRRACAIALLNPLPEVSAALLNLKIDYEFANHEERVKLLAELDRSADASMTPLHYSWIDISCHVSNLSFISVSLRRLVGSV